MIPVTPMYVSHLLGRSLWKSCAITWLLRQYVMTSLVSGALYVMAMVSMMLVGAVNMYLIVGWCGMC